MKSGAESFSEIGAGAGFGNPIPSGWVPVTACACLVLVGLTGVGKSTTLTQLSARLGESTLLPDRREITDRLMIPFIQEQNGLPLEPVTDRAERFNCTRHYREQFPGGMAHALSALAVAPKAAAGLLVFDGLRGENEVRHAAVLLPNARFLMLDAPDIVRIQRLVTRQDTFDSVTTAATPSSIPDGSSLTLASIGIPELADILNADGQRELLRWVVDGEVTSSDLTVKARIILAERRNYDPAATREALLAHAGDRSLIVDTDSTAPAEIAYRTVQWLDG